MAGPGAPVPVLLVESGRARGGTERVVDALARGLAPERFRPWVILDPSPALDLWADDLRRAGVPVERRAEMTSRWQWGRALGWLRALRGHRLRLLHVHHVYASADRYLVPLARLAGVRAIVVTEHLAAPPHSAAQRRLKRLELVGADATVAVSAAVADRLSREYGHAREIIEVIPNGVPAPPALASAERVLRRAAWGVPEGARAWLTVGRLEPQKGIDLLLEAWAALPELLPGGAAPFLVVVGEGSERAALEAQARSLGLSGRVRFAGAALDARPLYRAADGFVLASRFEGLPLALLESMAAGLPVVATAVEGVAEAAGADAAGEEAACVVPPGDPRALARAVADLETHPERARALGECAAARAARRYGEARMVAAYERLYRRALRLPDQGRREPADAPEAA